MMTTLHLPSPRFASLNPMAIAALLHLSLFGLVAWLWLALSGSAPGVGATVICAAPALLALALSFTSQADRNQYTLRLLAAALMLPIGLMMWAGSQDPVDGTSATATHLLLRHPWIFFSALALWHALAVVGGIVWLAAATTRVEPAAGTPRVTAAQLARRLASLQQAGLPLDIGPGDAADEWAVAWRYPAGVPRSHRVLLSVDEAAGEVRVRERRTANGATPDSSDEGSLRGIGESSYDPTRPSAKSVSFTETVATQVVPERLAAVPLMLHADRAVPGVGAARDPDAMVTLLCALVTRSGFVWQPELFSSPST